MNIQIKTIFFLIIAVLCINFEAKGAVAFGQISNVGSLEKKPGNNLKVVSFIGTAIVDRDEYWVSLDNDHPFEAIFSAPFCDLAETTFTLVHPYNFHPQENYWFESSASCVAVTNLVRKATPKCPVNVTLDLVRKRVIQIEPKCDSPISLPLAGVPNEKTTLVDGSVHIANPRFAYNYPGPNDTRMIQFAFNSYLRDVHRIPEGVCAYFGFSEVVSFEGGLLSFEPTYPYMALVDQTGGVKGIYTRTGGISENYESGIKSITCRGKRIVAAGTLEKEKLISLSDGWIALADSDCSRGKREMAEIAKNQCRVLGFDEERTKFKKLSCDVGNPGGVGVAQTCNCQAIALCRP